MMARVFYNIAMKKKEFRKEKEAVILDSYDP